MISVAIDGPSGAGKSSLAKRLAADMGFTYVDTGAMYRSIGLYAVRQGKDPHDAAAVEALLPQIHLDTKLEEGTQHFYLNGEDVSSAIRAEEIGMAASAVAAIPAVRTFLLDAQRTLAASRDVLMDGRDIGTVVLPNATVKIFLTATPEARAERRYKELLMKGEKHDYQNVLADVRARDYQDTHRAAAPLRQAAKFLQQGHKVKVSIRFRGREMAHTSLGIDVEQRFAQALEGKAVVDKQPKLEGRSMMMFLSPSPTK